MLTGGGGDLVLGQWTTELKVGERLPAPHRFVETGELLLRR